MEQRQFMDARSRARLRSVLPFGNIPGRDTVLHKQHGRFRPQAEIFFGFADLSALTWRVLILFMI